MNASRDRRVHIVTLALAVLLAGCGGGEVESDRAAGQDDQAGELNSDHGEDQFVATDDDNANANSSGDPNAFRLTGHGWENNCSVVDVDRVAAATGFTVLEAEEGQGCNWLIEAVDDNLVGGESSIGWAPMLSRQFDVQAEGAEKIGMGVVLEPIPGLGDQAFWAGNETNDLGEIWVKADPIAFRVVNFFASPSHPEDTRPPMESLAEEIVESLSNQDIVAASGEYAETLFPPVKIEVPEGVPTGAGLLPELDAFPLPDGPAEFSPGFVSDERAEQNVYLESSVGDTTRFFLEALPEAGFEIMPGDTETVDDVFEYAGNMISILDPDGNQGAVHVSEGVFAPSVVLIHIFSSD